MSQYQGEQAVVKEFRNTTAEVTRLQAAYYIATLGHTGLLAYDNAQSGKTGQQVVEPHANSFDTGRVDFWTRRYTHSGLRVDMAAELAVERAEAERLRAVGAGDINMSAADRAYRQKKQVLSALLQRWFGNIDDELGLVDTEDVTPNRAAINTLPENYFVASDDRALAMRIEYSMASGQQVLPGGHLGPTVDIIQTDLSMHSLSQYRPPTVLAAGEAPELQDAIIGINLPRDARSACMKWAGYHVELANEDMLADTILNLKNSVAPELRAHLNQMN